MDIQSIGQLIAQRRRAQGLTLLLLADRARVGRSTLAALESGKLGELGLTRVTRICAALDMIIEARPLHLDAPLMAHRHLTETAGRELTKAAVDDIITRGDLNAWRGLIKAMRADRTGRIARRAREVSTAQASHDVRARAFANLLPRLLRRPRRKRAVA